MRTLGEAISEVEKSSAEEEVLASSEHAWNVFAQILLPMVLILTFVVVSTVSWYRSAYELWQGVLDKDKQMAEVELIEKIIDLQLQKLLSAFERVQTNERKEFLITVFKTPNRVQRRGIFLEDEEFKEACLKAISKFSDAQYARYIYQRVLVDAGVSDPVRAEVQRWAVGGQEDERWLEIGEAELAKEGVITAVNRRNIQRLILDFVSGAKDEVVTIQVSVIRMLLDDLVLKGDLKTLRHQTLVVPKEVWSDAPREVRAALAANLQQKVVGILEQNLRQEGYELLPDSWESVKLR